jgi:hypothetical protein
MNKTPDFTGTRNNPDTTNNAHLNLTNNKMNSIAINNNIINDKSITLNSGTKINTFKISSNSGLEAEGFLKYSNSLSNSQLQSKSNISHLSRKINSNEEILNSKNNNLNENSHYSTTGILAHPNDFMGANINGNASIDFTNKFKINNKPGAGFANNIFNSNNNKNNENTASPSVHKNNSEKLQVRKLLIKENNGNNHHNYHSNNENHSKAGSLSDKRIEIIDYSKSKNMNSKSIKADEEEKGNNGIKKVLNDKLSKLFNNKESNLNNITHYDNGNNSNFSMPKNSNNYLNNHNNNFSIASNPNVIKSSKTIAFDKNLNNQIKGNNYVKKVAFRTLAGKTENGSTKTNQDNFVIMENILNCEDFKIYGVFDGHGNLKSNLTMQRMHTSIKIKRASKHNFKNKKILNKFLFSNFY